MGAFLEIPWENQEQKIGPKSVENPWKLVHEIHENPWKSENMVEKKAAWIGRNVPILSTKHHILETIWKNKCIIIAIINIYIYIYVEVQAFQHHCNNCRLDSSIPLVLNKTLQQKHPNNHQTNAHSRNHPDKRMELYIEHRLGNFNQSHPRLVFGA